MPDCDRFPEIASGGIGLGGVIGGIAGIVVGATNPVILAAFAVGGIGALTSGLTYTFRNIRERNNLLQDGGHAEARINAAAANVVNGLENLENLREELRATRARMAFLERQLEERQAEEVNMRAELNELRRRLDILSLRQNSPRAHRRIDGREQNAMFRPASEREAGSIDPTNNVLRGRAG